MALIIFYPNHSTWSRFRKRTELASHGSHTQTLTKAKGHTWTNSSTGLAASLQHKIRMPFPEGEMDHGQERQLMPTLQRAWYNWGGRAQEEAELNCGHFSISVPSTAFGTIVSRRSLPLLGCGLGLLLILIHLVSFLISPTTLVHIYWHSHSGTIWHEREKVREEGEEAVVLRKERSRDQENTIFPDDVDPWSSHQDVEFSLSLEAASGCSTRHVTLLCTSLK